MKFVLVIALLFGASASAENLRDFQTIDVYGNAIDLNALDGQWVVVNFWATWCKPCRKEIPDLSALHSERDDVSLLGLAFEEIPVARIVAFLEEFKASYPIALVDIYQPPAQFGMPRVLPTTLLISPAGENVKKFVGPVTRAMIEAEIDQYTDDG